MSSLAATSALYVSPAEEFNIIETLLAAQFATANFRAFRGPTMLIYTQGSGYISVGDYIELIECGWSRLFRRHQGGDLYPE